MDWSILVPSSVLFSGSLIFAISVWVLGRIISRLIDRLDKAEEFIRASANTQAYLTMEERSSPLESESKNGSYFSRTIE